MTALTIPRLAGTRGGAQQFVDDHAVTDSAVTLDFTGCASATQGFCDELVKQLVARGNRIAGVTGANDHVRSHLELALRIRDLPYPPGLSAPRDVQYILLPNTALTAESARAHVEQLTTPVRDLILDFEDCSAVSDTFLVPLLAAAHPWRTLTVVRAQTGQLLMVHAAVRKLHRGILDA